MLWVARYLSSFFIALLDVLRPTSPVLLYFKHFCKILLNFLRILYIFSLPRRWLLCQLTVDCFLVTTHCCMSPILSLSLFVLPLMYLQSFFVLNALLPKTRKHSDGFCWAVVPPTKYVRYMYSSKFSLASLLKKNFLCKHKDREQTMTPLWSYLLTRKLYLIIMLTLT